MDERERTAAERDRREATEYLESVVQTLRRDGMPRLPGVLLMALYQLLTRNFTSRGKQQVNILAAVVALTLNVGLNIVLIPRFGIAGAALANGLSYGTAALTLLIAFVRDSGHTVAETLIVRPGEITEMADTARKLAGRLQRRSA